jgi:dissimilatory sulfite reductase (desulfoviridin) alpha/beta subunit
MRYYGVKEFIDAHCIVGPRRLISVKSLYDHYVNTAPSYMEIMSKKRVGHILRRLGFLPYRTKICRFYRGLDI